jgi:tRNA-dihydrouridine synthase
MLPASFQIRDLTIRPAAVLAPMAGVTDTLFRRVIRGLGSCGLLMTEFTSSEGITRSAAKTLRYLYFQEDEHPITAQLFGANPKVMAEAARMVEDLGYDAVDINLGCPAKKVVKCGGSGLLRDLPLLGEIFKTVRAAVNIPLTIKLRAGWDENSIVAVEVAKMAESIGVEGVAVHASAGLRRLRRLEYHCCREAGGENSRHRQWRYQHARRRRAHGPRNRLRRRYDRPSRRHQSLDFPSDAAIRRERPIRHTDGGRAPSVTFWLL